VFDDLGGNAIDVEVVHAIVKYLSKLKILEASIYSTINAGWIGMTEEMAIIIAKRLPQLLSLSNN
jgi:hypothetical protein